MGIYKILKESHEIPSFCYSEKPRISEIPGLQKYYVSTMFTMFFLCWFPTIPGPAGRVVAPGEKERYHMFPRSARR